MTEIASLGLKVEGVNNVDKASGSLDRFSKSGDRADKSARGAAGGIKTTGVESEKSARSLTSMAGAARVAVGALAALGATAAIRRMVHTFADFESGMARVRAVSGATNAEFAALTETARRLGATTEFTGTQAASGLEFLARAGWSANESIAALPAVLNLATAASMDLGAAADVASNIMSAFGIAASEASSVADVLAAASSRANTDVQQLGNAMAFVGPVAAALKIPMGDAAAAVGALSDAGIQGSAAGTGLRRVLSSLANPTGAAAKSLQSLGVELETVNPATNSLVDIVDRLSASGMSAADALTIFGDRGGPAILALVENNAKVRELSGGLRDVAGESERMAGIMRDTLTGDMQTFSSAMQDLAITIASELGPSLRGVVQSATSFVRLLSDSMAEIKLVAGILGSLATAYLAVQTGAALATVAKWAYAKSSAAVVAGSVSAATSVMTLSGALYTLAGAAGAFMVGFQIGKYLREEFEFVEKIGISLAAGFQKTFATLEGQMQKIGATIGYALSNPLDLARTKIIDFLQFLASLGGPALDLLGLGGMMDGITAKLDEWRPETEAQFRQTLETIEAETKEKIGNIDAIYADMFANVGREAPKTQKAVEDMGKAVEDMGEGGAVAVKKLGDEITRVQDLFDRDEFGFAGYEDPFDPELFDPLMDAADTLAGKWERATGSIIDGLGQVKDTMAEGSKEAQTLGQAMQALQVVQGIAAILNQGMGDPYTAIGRMAAMAAAVASLIGSVGFAGSGNTAAADAQAAQGTGGVLGDAEAQSESIMKGVEITADATSQLVGINRAQLVALESMRDAISGASTQIMRGQDFSSSEQQWNVSNMIYGDDWEHYLSEGLRTFLDPVTVWADELLGGSRAIINSGIEIAGGAITDLINNTVVSAFQDVESKKHFLDSKSTRRFSELLGDEVGQQFAMVFGGMVDAVSASAEVLGFTEDQIRDSIAKFRIAATEISLMDLTGEEQNAAISAVFSDIFDDLATTVIPFIGQFQQAGEGMAETLIRISTQVQVAEEAMSQLGMSLLDGLAGLDLAQLSDDLISAAGGMEQFITGFTGFVDKFATEEHKFNVATNSINSAMSQLGLEVPQSEEALWELMQTLTDPAQIAGLLRLQDSFATMFDMMDKEASQAFDLNIQLLRLQGKEEEALALIRERTLEGMSESNRALQEQIWAMQDLEAAADKAAQAQQALADFQRGIADQILDIVSPAHAELERLNRAMGNQIEQAQELGIAEEDLANMRRLHQLQLLEFAAGLEESIASLSDQLFGEAESGMDRTVNSVGEGMNRVRDLMIRGIAQVNDWLQSSMLSNVSPLTPEQRLAEAESQFFSQAAAAQTDPTQIAGLRGLADQLLSEASGFFGGSTQEFDDIWMRVRGAMEGVAGMSIPDAVDPQRAIQTATESTAMSALQQITLASDMIGQIAALSRVTGETPADIAERLGVPIGGLLDILESTPGEFAGAMDENFNDLVNGFDMTIDPLLSVQNAQLEETRQMRNEQNERLERIEQALLDGVNYQRATAVNTGETANQQGQAVAIQRRNENKPSGAGRINV